ncbi:uncharacterized protein LOC131035338 [Cryptomeria japonica]|uniref:uncharacterized protein LOC131035338 n=1 Tax=Cryptomeria japonica TaxID=3369 RepID=UPI0027DA38CB|nr:uncharacterized protein LOC131035338 [Cryptomeria japonica]
MGKMNFVEMRTFWHIFRSFDRMWTFLVLALQVMITVAWNGCESLEDIYQKDIIPMANAHTANDAAAAQQSVKANRLSIPVEAAAMSRLCEYLKRIDNTESYKNRKD